MSRYRANGMQQAGDIGDLKAISLNLMHGNLSITDGIYAILSGDEVQGRIAELGKAAGREPTGADVAAALRMLADQLEKGNGE